MGDSLETAARQLAAIVWKTKGSRLSGHRRLQLTHQWSIWGIAIASIYVIALSLIGPVLDEADTVLLWSPIIAAVSATGILALSLLEAGQRYELRAERMHEAGLSLGELGGKLDLFLAREGGSHEELESLRAEYDEILRNNKENHNPIDYQYFMATRPHEFPIQLQKRWAIIARWNLTALWRSVVVIVTPVALVVPTVIR